MVANGSVCVCVDQRSSIFNPVKAGFLGLPVETTAH